MNLLENTTTMQRLAMLKALECVLVFKRKPEAASCTKQFRSAAQVYILTFYSLPSNISRQQRYYLNSVIYVILAKILIL